MGKKEVVAEGEDHPDHLEAVVVEVVVEGEDHPDHSEAVVVEVVVVDPHVLHMLARNNVFLLSDSLVDLCSWKALSRSR